MLLHAILSEIFLIKIEQLIFEKSPFDLSIIMNISKSQTQYITKNYFLFFICTFKLNPLFPCACISTAIGIRLLPEYIGVHS